MLGGCISLFLVLGGCLTVGIKGRMVQEESRQ